MMLRAHSIMSLLMIYLFVVPQITLAGKLDSVREEVREDPRDEDEAPPKKKKKRRKSSGNNVIFAFGASDDDCDDDDDPMTLSELGTSIVAGATLFAVTSPWWAPRSILESEEVYETAFSAYPYDDDHIGYMLVNRDVEEVLERADGWAARLRTEYATDFSGLHRVGGRAILESAETRFGIDTEWNYWTEDPGRTEDTLWTGDANLIWRFAQSEQVQFRSGVGINWLADADRGDVGFNFTYGVDIFPVDPWVLETTLDWGRLGDTDLLHLRTSIGLVWEHVELFTGYDYYRVSDTDLNGFVVGAQFWF